MSSSMMPENIEKHVGNVCTNHELDPAIHLCGNDGLADSFDFDPKVRSPVSCQIRVSVVELSNSPVEAQPSKLSPAAVIDDECVHIEAHGTNRGPDMCFATESFVRSPRMAFAGGSRTIIPLRIGHYVK